MTGHLTLRERIADAIARTDCDTPVSVHPLMEDYLPHASAALEAGINRRLAYHDRRVEWARRAGREEAQDQLREEIQARDAERDEEIAIRDARIAELEADLALFQRDAVDPVAEHEAEYLRAEAMDAHMDDHKYEEGEP